MCSCQPEFIGSPPGCRPECSASTECPLNLACVNKRCVDPCPNNCGLNTQCVTVNHSPICSCQSGFSGDPFVRCSPVTRKPPTTSKVKSFFFHFSMWQINLLSPVATVPDVPTVKSDPCVPSPCGNNALCRTEGPIPVCACQMNYIGQPPNCRPECSIHAECAANEACINLKCRDPCPGSCGANANCQVVNHIPACTCSDGFTGDPFTNCSPLPPSKQTFGPLVTANLPWPRICEIKRMTWCVLVEPTIIRDLCNPSPCGSNALCSDGVCTCMPEFRGNPYAGCRPECVLNTDCSRDLACIRNKCTNPCPGVCASNADCNVINHIPMCSCPANMTGNAFSFCTPVRGIYCPLFYCIILTILVLRSF